jgi:RNA polymerase sigma factor (TIGR02999 family)
VRNGSVPWSSSAQSAAGLLKSTVPFTYTESVNSGEERGRVTALLRELSAGDQQALDALLPLVYEGLRGIAHRQLRGERSGHTLNTTALVNEAYLKMVDLQRISFRDRAHFFGVAAGTMRRLLVDYAVRRNAAKRGGGKAPVTLEEVALDGEVSLEDVLTIEKALLRLENLEPRHGRVVECRFFAGLTVEETAAALDISTATVKRDWALARAFLNRELMDGAGGA